MILQLGSATEFIRVTAEYSNAVLLAILPHFSNFVQKLDLPCSITPEHVINCGILPWRNKDGGIGGGGITVSGGWSFSFQFGYVNSFASPNSYYSKQDSFGISKYYGVVRMNEEEAVQLARNTLKKLGIPLESVFAEQMPRVTLPPKIGTNVVPHYRVEWLDPRGGFHTVDLDINAETRRVESLWMLNKSLERPPPKVSVVPPKENGFIPYQEPQINPEYVRELIPIVFQAIDDYGEKLFLPVPRPLTTNCVARFSIDDNGGWPHCEIELTNGWRFIYRNSMVNGYYSPDNFCNSDNRSIRINDFIGKWNLTEQQAIELVRKTIVKMNYPTNFLHMDFVPHVIKPTGNFSKIIPRYFFEWHYAPQDELLSKVEAEVDADKGEVKSLYYDDVSYWNHPPPIGVPISLPTSQRAQ